MNTSPPLQFLYRAFLRNRTYKPQKSFGALNTYKPPKPMYRAFLRNNAYKSQKSFGALNTYKPPRPVGCHELHVIFCKRATNYRALLRKMTYKDRASHGSSPPQYSFGALNTYKPPKTCRTCAGLFCGHNIAMREPKVNRIRSSFARKWLFGGIYRALLRHVEVSFAGLLWTQDSMCESMDSHMIVVKKESKYPSVLCMYRAVCCSDLQIGVQKK